MIVFASLCFFSIGMLAGLGLAYPLPKKRWLEGHPDGGTTTTLTRLVMSSHRVFGGSF